jgi:hypothetical protein
MQRNSQFLDVSTIFEKPVGDPDHTDTRNILVFRNVRTPVFSATPHSSLTNTFTIVQQIWIVGGSVRDLVANRNVIVSRATRKSYLDRAHWTQNLRAASRSVRLRGNDRIWEPVAGDVLKRNAASLPVFSPCT